MTTTHPASTTCYWRGCKQPACLTAGRRYNKQLRYDRAHGIARMHDATQVRNHIERLTTHDWTHQQIATAANIPRSTISTLAAGQRKTSKHNALAVLGIPIGPPPADPTRVDATGSIRRIRALAYIGHSLVSLAQRLGMTVDRLSALARAAVTVVRAPEAARIARLYRQLAAVPGPSRRARNQARRKGWHGPLAWDDIDDPAAVPDVEEGTGQRGRPAQVDTARVVRLTRQGLNAAQIARELGCHARTVVRARGRALDRRQPAGRAAA